MDASAVRRISPAGDGITIEGHGRDARLARSSIYCAWESCLSRIKAPRRQALARASRNCHAPDDEPAAAMAAATTSMTRSGCFRTGASCRSPSIRNRWRMVERIVWQINPGDFHGDTQDMSNAEVGAYMLLLMTYWRVGSLPDDDPSLRRIARADYRQWKRMKPRLQRLFHDGWKHKRMEADLAKLAKYREHQQANACGKNGTPSTKSVHNGTSSSASRSSARSGDNPLKSFNPTPATAPHSLLPLRKIDNSFFGTGSKSRSWPVCG